MSSLEVNTTFDCSGIDADEKLVFTPMHYEEKRNKIYNDIIKPTVESKQLRCERADNLKTNNAIIRDIVENICRSRFMIADISDYNSNVVYEIRIAHAMKKEIIMIYEVTENQPDFPFDIRHIRELGYIYDPSGGKKLKRDLDSTIDYVLSKTTPCQNHIGYSRQDCRSKA
jgi:hypothetical protein